jgi:hypothetical protein
MVEPTTNTRYSLSYAAGKAQLRDGRLHVTVATTLTGFGLTSGLAVANSARQPGHSPELAHSAPGPRGSALCEHSDHSQDDWPDPGRGNEIGFSPRARQRWAMGDGLA